MDEPANVLSLIQPSGPIDETMIPALEDLLAAAKRGDVACVAYTTVLRDGAIQTAMSPPHQHVFTMLGAIERLKLRFHALHVMEPGE